MDSQSTVGLYYGRKAVAELSGSVSGSAAESMGNWLEKFARGVASFQAGVPIVSIDGWTSVLVEEGFILFNGTHVIEDKYLGEFYARMRVVVTATKIKLLGDFEDNRLLEITTGLLIGEAPSVEEGLYLVRALTATSLGRGKATIQLKQDEDRTTLILSCIEGGDPSGVLARIPSRPDYYAAWDEWSEYARRAIRAVLDAEVAASFD